MADTIGKRQIVTLNLAAAMDTRTNDEVLDISAANQRGLPCYFLQNGDLFYTNSLTVRQGVVDVCGGPLQASGIPALVYNLYSGSAATQYTKEPIYLAPNFPDREGQLISFGGYNATGTMNAFNIIQGTFYIQDTATSSNPAEAGYDVSIQVYLNQVNTTSQSTTGTEFVDAGGIHNIALSGNFNVDVPYPQLVGARNDVYFQDLDPVPLAISDNAIVNFGTNYVTGNGAPQQGNLFGTPFVEVPWQFSVPYPLENLTTYCLSIIANNTSGTTPRGLQVNVMSDGVDHQPNAIYVNTYVNTTSGIFHSSLIRPQEDVSLPVGQKGWLQGVTDEYISANYLLQDFAAANYTISSPISGTVPQSSFGQPSNVNWQAAPNTNPFPGLTQVPTVSTTAAPFGQVFTLTTGTYTINGGYVSANTWTGNGYQFFTTSKQVLDTTDYTVDYVCTLLQANQGTGSVATPLASFTGTYTFDNPNTYQGVITNQNLTSNIDMGAGGPSANLEQIYALFQNPAIVTVTGTSNFILSWQFLNTNTGLPITDYGVRNNTTGFYEIVSPISIGLNNHYQGGDNFVYQAGNGAWGIYYGFSDIQMSCGVMSIPSGNAIKGLYDYRVGASRSQAVMYTQNDRLGTFQLDNPTTQTILYTGISIGDNLKSSFSTFQNLLITNDYSQTSGTEWDQIYYATPTNSGNYGSVQQLGLMPIFSGIGVHITGTLPQSSAGIPFSGANFSVIIGTSILSGGIRASNILNVSGNGATGTASNFPSGSNVLQIYGVQSNNNDATWPYDIYHVSGLAASGISTQGQSQYKFNVFSNGTYVFATQNVSGASAPGTYFFAPLCDSKGNPLPNPLPNNNTWNAYTPYYSGTNTTPGSGVYIYDINFTGVNSLQVPNIITEGQTYLLNQSPTPMFKKTILFNNILFGIGDPNYPSRIWYSDIGDPDIWGIGQAVTAGGAYGYYDIDPDNGQELTGIEIYKGYLIIFKENSTYAGQYTYTAGNPLNIQQIDNNKGNLSIFATVSTAYGVFGMSQFGPVLATYYGVETIADEIYNYFQNLSHTDLIYSVAVHDIARQQIYWSIADSSQNEDNQTGLVYSYALKKWGTRQNGMWNAAGTIGDVNNFNLLYIGDTIGQIKQLNSGSYTDDQLFVAIDGTELNQTVELQFEGRWWNFQGNSQDLKEAGSLRINCANSDQILQVEVYYDQNTTPVYSRPLDMSQPVNNRVISLSGVFNTMKVVCYNYGTADMVQINSMQLSFINRGPSTNIN